MKTLSIGLQHFKDIVENNKIYVDKTDIILELLKEEKSFYFLSRPRRFGKSLLITTLYEIFKGNKELFKGYFIYDKWRFEEYPIIYISFLGVNYKEKTISNGLIDKLKEIAKEYDIVLEKQYLKDVFIELINKLNEKYKKEVVILIDEYDKPIIDYLNNIEQAKENRDDLKSFYIVLKEMSNKIKFCLITGVTKFSKVSIFSDLNHLTDLTIDDRYSTICGYTKEEIVNNYDDWLELFAKKEKVTKDELLEEIKKWYNGYSWDLVNYVYNPFSLLNAFQKKSFENYWFETGTPTFLLDLIKTELKQEVSLFDFQTLDNISTNKNLLGKFDIENLGLIDVLFQTGYLTLKNYDKKFNEYSLGFPNKEVKDSFMNNLIQYLTKTQAGITSYLLKTITISLEKKDITQLIQSLKSLFASIPHNMFLEKEERYYQTIIYTALQIVGINIDCEVETNIGRVDAVIKTDNYIYIIEFKANTKERKAIEQIIDKKYYEKYLSQKKHIVLMGIYFDKSIRNIIDFEEMDIKQLI
ncbi:AAA family ATPase [bacterium]|nr:AAA family ATPase [bacterium]